MPLLYQVATAALSPAEVAAPIRHVLNRFRNVEVVMGEVVGLDLGARAVALDGGRQVTYDRLVLAAGSGKNYFGHPEWQRFAPGLKTLGDAREIRSRVLAAFEQAEICTDPQQRKRLLTMIVVGGGTTGVEMAGALSELARSLLARDFRTLHPSDASVLLIEGGSRLLAGFPPHLGTYARKALERLGVAVRLNTAVRAVDEAGIMAGETPIPAATVIWAAGVAASPAGAWLGVALDRHGRVAVGPDLSVPGLPEISVLGDLARCLDAEGRELPGLAAVAQQQGRYLGRALRGRLLNHAEPPPFRYRDLGQLATIGRNAAVAVFGRVRLRGFVAWVLWGGVHIVLLIGFRNRAVVALSWLLAYLTHQPGARLILRDGEEAPPAAPGPPS